MQGSEETRRLAKLAIGSATDLMATEVAHAAVSKELRGADRSLLVLCCMSTKERKTEGALEKLGGQVKKDLGWAIGSDRLKKEGEAQELRGHIRREEAKAEERAKGESDRIAGKLKKNLGAFLGDTEKQAEGRAQEEAARSESP